MIQVFIIFNGSIETNQTQFSIFATFCLKLHFIRFSDYEENRDYVIVVKDRVCPSFSLIVMHFFLLMALGTLLELYTKY